MAVCVMQGVRWMKVDDGIVVLVPDPPQFVDLNESATELWDVLIGGGWRPGLAVEHLAASYGTGVDAATEIVEFFLADLEERSVISRAV